MDLTLEQAVAMWRPPSLDLDHWVTGCCPGCLADSYPLKHLSWTCRLRHSVGWRGRTLRWRGVELRRGSAGHDLLLFLIPFCRA